MRKATVQRKTAETDIQLSLTLDGEGRFEGSCGIHFFDHMLNLFCRHGLFDLSLGMQGDLEVDGHHSLEDLGIVLGQAFAQALGDKAGICRYGSFLLPMDEALATVALDLSGRPYLALSANLLTDEIGDFDTELLEEFLRAFVTAGGITLHIRQEGGKNGHHIVEAIFKGLGRALRQAVSLDAREKGVPSTKGVLA